MPRRVAFTAVALLIAVACVRVASTTQLFSATMDEATHLAAGFEWLRGEYILDMTHGPLARIGPALVLRLSGVRAGDVTGTGDQQGQAILFSGRGFRKNLARARYANLLFLIAAALAVWFQARRDFSAGTALLAVALYTTLPAILAHAGLVTTDMAVAAMVPLALLAADHWLARPGWRSGALLGLAIGLGVLAKMSFFLFFPAGVILLILFRRTGAAAAVPRLRVSSLLLALSLAFVVVWGGYFFKVARPADYWEHARYFVTYVTPPSLKRVGEMLLTTPLPAPQLLCGLAQLEHHQMTGHVGFLLGKTSSKGWWYYFPVVLFYKTPLPFLIFGAAGVAIALLRRSRPVVMHAAIAAAMLAVTLHASINIGIRHVLPLYAPLSIVAAYGAMELWRRARTRFEKTAMVALALWLWVGVAAGHPDYLSWYNELAGSEPWRIALDSNYDWGQDLYRLERYLREQDLHELRFEYLTTVPPEKLGIHWLPPDREKKTTGWFAIGETPLALHRANGEYRWLTYYRPVRRIGKTIRLYYIPQ